MRDRYLPIQETCKIIFSYILVGKSEGKRLLERYRWEDNVKMDFKKAECYSVHRINLA
jgi:hypothetical protein